MIRNFRTHMLYRRMYLELLDGHPPLKAWWMALKDYVFKTNSLEGANND